MEWAPVLYTRRENNDFDPLAAPHDMIPTNKKKGLSTSLASSDSQDESELALWTEWMTLATSLSLRESEGFKHGPRFALLRRKNRCIFGIGCYVKDIAANTNDPYCKKGKVDNYLFAGFCSSAIKPGEEIRLPVDINQLRTAMYKPLTEGHLLHEHLEILRERWLDPAWPHADSKTIAQTTYSDLKDSPLHFATVQQNVIPSQIQFNHHWQEVYVWDDTDSNRFLLWDAACEHVARQIASSTVEGEPDSFSLYLGMRARNDVTSAPMSADHHKFGCIYNATVRGLNVTDRQIIWIEGTEPHQREEPVSAPDASAPIAPTGDADQADDFQTWLLLSGAIGAGALALANQVWIKIAGGAWALCVCYMERGVIKRKILKIIGASSDTVNSKNPTTDSRSSVDDETSEQETTATDGMTDEEFEKQMADLKRQQQSSPNTGGKPKPSNKKEADWD